MTVQTIPLAVTPNQSFSVVLGDWDLDVTLRTLGGALYVTVVCNDVPVCAGQLCLDRVDLVPRAAYLGFPGLGLQFEDQRGTTDPAWSEFGTRYALRAMTP